MFAHDAVLQPPTAPGRYFIQWRTKHGDGAAAELYRRRVGNGVDAQRQPAEYGDVPFHQLGHQPASPPDSGREWVA